MKIFFSFLTIILAGTNLWAGWGSSGGGEFLKDLQNPWWVRNTKEVKYCIQIDQTGISATPKVIRSDVKGAISFWKKELTATVPNSTFNRLFEQTGVGQQEFAEITCDGTEDLKIQFGYNTLTEQQIKNLGEVTQYIGVAVRTNYDEVNLRGRGFIFIGSDVGEHQFDGDTPIVDKAWSVPNLLAIIVAHEMGHIFGVPHVGSEFSLMSQQGPALYLNPIVANVIGKATNTEFPYPIFFRPSPIAKWTSTDEFPFDEKTFDFFGLNKDTHIVSLDTLQNDHIEVSTQNKKDDPKTVIGYINGSKVSELMSPAIMIHLTKKQIVFSDSEKKDSFPIIFGPAFISYNLTGGLYESTDGKSPGKAISATMAGEGSQVFGLIDNRIEPILTLKLATH